MRTVSSPRPLTVLDGAVAWTLGCLQLARSRRPDLPTPCTRWDLGQLLEHLEDSLAAIAEAGERGHVDLSRRPGPPEPGMLVDRIVGRACLARAAWRQRLTSAPVAVGDLPLGRDTVVLVGALEIAVHGWDVARACGAELVMPEDLAWSLYDVAVAVVTPEERGRRFGAAVAAAPHATAGDRLVAHLGRTPP